MPEGANVEIAHKLHEQAEEEKVRERPVEILEIVEAILLALVAVATAWSGYQSARWDGRNALYYGEATKYRAQSNLLATQGGQLHLYDVVTFDTWISAAVIGHSKLASFYVRRFSPEFRVAFDAWLKTDPVHNPNAPAGPAFMPQYRNHLMDQSAALDKKSTDTFEQGTAARETGDEYIRTTVLLASVLFLIAISQRFRFRLVRLSLLGVSVVLLGIALYNVATYPVA